MDIGEVRGIIAAVTMLAFLGVAWWAYRPRNRDRFEEDALYPFLDEAESPEASASTSAPEAEGEQG
ncbi:MAG: cbb3-type cytochrome c oxidase subunit 3 [Myxococcota bacterium]|nr:cbb3-type cytochrome c oxidase subunit 3 [Myxococcota bacterium]